MKINYRFGVLLLCLLITSGLASAQTITGAITGTVMDPSGSVIPNVKVAATNTATNISTEAQTNESGVYNLLFLPIGDYNLTASAQGFKKSSIGPFRLDGSQTARVDVKLEIGDTTQVVEVTGVAPILQTETTQTGDTLTTAKLTSLPLKGRNFMALTQMIPGAITTNPGWTQQPLRRPALRQRQPRADQQLHARRRRRQ